MKHVKAKAIADCRHGRSVSSGGHKEHPLLLGAYAIGHEPHLLPVRLELHVLLAEQNPGLHWKTTARKV